MSCKFRNAQVAQNISGKSRSNRWNLPQVAPNIYIYWAIWAKSNVLANWY